MSFDIPLAVEESKAIAAFMKLKFSDMMWNTGSAQRRPGPLIPYPEGWSLEFAIEVDLAVSIIVQAFNNQGASNPILIKDLMIHVHVHEDRTNWDIERYAEHITLKNTGITNDFDKFLQSKFEPLPDKTVTLRPRTVADRHGQLLLWYLPGIFTAKRRVCYEVLDCSAFSHEQNSMFDDLKFLESALKCSPSGNWRTGPEFFSPIPGGLKAGVVNFSPAWFELGHQVFNG